MEFDKTVFTCHPARTAEPTPVELKHSLSICVSPVYGVWSSCLSSKWACDGYGSYRFGSDNRLLIFGEWMFCRNISPHSVKVGALNPHILTRFGMVFRIKVCRPRNKWLKKRCYSWSLCTKLCCFVDQRNAFLPLSNKIWRAKTGTDIIVLIISIFLSK